MRAVFRRMGVTMWGFARYRLVSLSIGIAAATAARAETTQSDCWPQKPFDEKSALSLTTTKTKTLSVSFRDPAEVIISTAGEVRLKQASGQLTDASDLFLQDVSGHYYEVRQAPLIVDAGTVIDIASTVTLADNKIPVGTNSTVKLETGQQLGVKLAAPVKLTPSSIFGRDDLRPQRLPSATPPHTIKAKAFKLGEDFGASKKDLSACIFDGEKWEHASIEAITATDDSANLAIALPSSLNSYSWKYKLAVMLPDGKYVGNGVFWMVPTPVAATVALLVLFIGHFWIWAIVIAKSSTPDLAQSGWNRLKEFVKNGSVGKFSQAWFSGGSDRVPSLSMFQIYVWTWLTIVRLTYVVSVTGELFAITQQMLWLLGISGLGSLAARFVAGPPIRTEDTPKFSDILKTSGEFDLYKLQMFLFTVYTAGFVAVRIAFDQAFPVLETNLLLLMGISNGIYVGSKVPTAGSATPSGRVPTVTAITPNAGPNDVSVTITGTNFTGATGVKFGATAAASFTVNSDTSITATSPAGSGKVHVTVTAPGGTSATSAADEFTYR